MKRNKLIKIIISLFFFNFCFVKNDYAIFDLNTYKNNSFYKEEYINFYFNNFNNILYTNIILGPNKEKFIMEIKSDTKGFTIFNHNCEIPPPDNSNISNYSPTLANSTIIESIDDNETTIFEEYFTSILENTIYINTNNGEKSTIIDFVFSPRNDPDYLKRINLRPYTCFTLSFDINYIYKIEDIDTVDDIALNLIFQFKKKNIISSYNWFIEYDSNNNNIGKLILGEKPYKYNPNKYKEENERIMNAEKRKDNKIYWDIKMNEIYIKKGEESMPIDYYLSCSLEPTLGVIIGPIGYKLIMEEYVFNPLMNENKCFKSDKIENKYVMYYCNKDMKDFLQKSNYNNIYFLHRFYGKLFELNYDDLFEENGNYIYFKVIFTYNDNNDLWRFGKPFLKKYFFSYDLDGRTISFYDIKENDKNNGNDNNENNNKNNNENNNENNKDNTLLIIIFIILILIFAVLGFILAKYFYLNKKKKKGTELIENDEYDYGSINPINK